MARAASEITADEELLSHGNVLAAHEARIMQFMEERFLALEQNLKTWFRDQMHDQIGLTSPLTEPYDLQVGCQVASELAVTTLSVAIDDLPPGIDNSLLREAIPLLQAPLPAKCVAQAYRKVVEVRSKSPASCEELMKHVQLVVREVLVLKICSSNGKLTYAGFKHACEQAFCRVLTSNMHSVFELSRCAICRYGSNRQTFNEFVDKKFSSWDGDRDALFRVYQDCYRNCKRITQKDQQKPRRAKKTSSSNATAEAELNEPEHVDAATSVSACAGPAAETSSQAKSATQLWLDGAADAGWAENALTANTFVPIASTGVGMLQCSFCQATCAPESPSQDWCYFGEYLYCSHCACLSVWR